MKKFNIDVLNLAIIFFLIFIVSISQFILASKHLQMGFFTDDWLFLSIYRTFVTNPLLDILQAWKEIGSHNFGYVYYLGILYNFFGLDYSAYRIINQILKIAATLSLYPVVLYVSKRKLLAFLSTFIYAIHFSSFGLLDGPSRGGDFLAIVFMNIFLAVYFYISKRRLLNIFTLLGVAAWLFTTILLGPTRLFPLLAIVPLIEILNFIQHKTLNQIKESLKRLLILYSPLLFLFIFSPESITVQLGYFGGLLEKLKAENWQLLLTPFAALGSTYIPSDFWRYFGTPVYDNFSSYLSFFLFGPIFIYCVILVLLGFFISNNSLKFILRGLILNFITGMVIFLIAHNWIYLDKITRAPVDPGLFLIPSLIGLFVVTTCFSLFLEWKESKKESSLLPFLFLAPIFSLTFIILTWIFADINSIFMGIHAYLNIPSIGTSIVIATIVVLIYEKLKLFRIFGQTKIVSVVIITVFVGLYFRLNFLVLDDYFSNWLKNGVSTVDQQRVWNHFWREVGTHKIYDQNNLPLIYFDTASGEYENGAYYEQVIIWRLASWFDLKFNNNKANRFDLCDIEILGKPEFEKFITVSEDGKTLTTNKCKTRIYKIEDFFAFKFKDRNLVPNRLEVLKELGIGQ